MKKPSSCSASAPTPILSAVRSDEELLRDFSIALTGRIRLGDLVLQGAQMLMFLI